MTATSLRRRAALFALLLLSACATAGQNGGAAAAPRPRTSVVVRNSLFEAYTIYAVSGTDRRRLGVVNPASSATFVIPTGMVVGTESLRFVADPIGSSAVSSTYTLPVHEGDTLELSLQ
ncbi:MAG TPA: hypothetical protein VF541_08565 [Longimicrobium sp.]|jgi:hypothetical protein